MSLQEPREDMRLAEIEARLQRIESRLGLLEHSNTPDVESVIALPGIAKVEAQDPEYWIGAKLLPRLGAVIIVLAIAFVAILESSKEATFNRALLLVIEAAVCFLFIAIGEWKRDELEGFGKTLTAIGSCGLYLTAAGGHFAYHQLTAAGMAAGFALLTLLNHAYSAWRDTRLFFFIGATGGLAAMLFPLEQKDYATALAAYVGVTVAGAAVCWIRRWMGLAIVGWVMGLAVLAPAIDSDFSRTAILAALYLGSLACIGAATHAYAPHSVDPWGIGAALSTFLTGIVGFIVLGGPGAAVHLVILAVTGIGAAFLVSRESGARRALIVGSLAAAAILGPLGSQPFVSAFVYVALAACACVVGSTMYRSLSAASSGILLVMAGISYARAGAEPQGPMVVVLACGLLCSAMAFRNAGWDWISVCVAGFWLLAARSAHLLAPHTGETELPYSYLTITCGMYALAVMVLGFRMKSAPLRLWSFGLMAASVLEVLAIEGGTSVGFRLGSMVVLGGIMLGGGYHYVHERRAQLEG